ncbi:MAG TPA: zinc-binding alcohol dehydrogenase, partial [Planctomycetota bacterium]|nr:zinc-binding alcohol dehydrogenase [Planctomycetota bacterium]
VFSPRFHQTHFKAKADEVIVLPDGLSDEHATFYGLASIAVTAVHVAPVTIGGQVVVIGMGIVGNLCAQFYNITGAGIVVGVDLSEKRLARATLCGIPKTFNTGQRPLSECCKELGERGAEWIIEAVGNARAIAEALKCAPRKGKVVLLGSPRTVMEIDPYNDIHRGGVQVIGAHGNAVDPSQRRFENTLLMNWLRSGKLIVDPLITQRMAFHQAAQAYAGLRDKPDEYMGVMLTYA